MNRLSLFLLAFALPALAIADGPAPEGPIPLRDFARLSDYSDLKISPDGKYMSAQVFSGDHNSLAIIRLSDKKITGVLNFRDDQSISEYWWVSPGRVAASLS